MRRILIIDKEPRPEALLRCRFGRAVKVKSVDCIQEASEKLTGRKIELIIWNAATDQCAVVDHGETLALLMQKNPQTRVVVLGDPKSINIPKICGDNVRIFPLPTNQEELCSLVERNLSTLEFQSDIDQSGVPINFEGIIAVSLPMQAIIRRIMDAAAVDIPVLITGETGTGKDLVAAAIHRRSTRKSKPYIPVNMGAMPRELIASEIFGHERGAYTGAQDTHPGIFEQGNGGTVFLDEVATMDEKSQISLLRILEDKTFRRVGGSKNISTDVRVIAATNEDLEKNVAEKRFREDLFYRLNVFQFRVPPLRERISAITALTNHFVSRYCDVYRKNVKAVSPETYRLLRHYTWPGNVRELKNAIQTSILMVEGNELTPEFIPSRIREFSATTTTNHRGPTCSLRVGTTLDSAEHELIRMTLSHIGDNKKLGASILGISRRALYNKMKRHGLI
jgi:DNA-binding NtrC family response regulator